MDPVIDAPRQHSFFVHYVVVGLVGSLLVAIGSLVLIYIYRVITWKPRQTD